MRLKPSTTNVRRSAPDQSRRSEGGSVLLIVLWIALGLVTITLYFANSSSYELQAADNRISGMESEAAIDGAARYVSYVLANYATNGVMPDQTYYQTAGVAVGNSHFWLIGRDTNSPPINPDQVSFGLTDENSKLNINTANLAMLSSLPNILPDFAANIVTWRTNGDTTSGGVGPEEYAMLSPPYQPTSEPFETVDELRLVYGADMDTLTGEDANRNGVLDPNEIDANRNGVVDPGILEYITVYSREPNTTSDGTPLINVRTLNTSARTQLGSLLATNFTTERATNIMRQLGTTGSASPLQFFLASGMTTDEFALIEDQITTITNTYVDGRVNINTATATVLACIPGISNNVDTLVSYRQSNPDKLTSIGWVIDALGLKGTQATQLATQIGNRITIKSYQFMADVAAVGPYGRGYRRVCFIFDTSDGTPKIIYRRDLTHLGWALGKDVRQAVLAQNTQQ
jgi:DNA uptake protein ComE-like DNA-binding protein